MTHVELQHITIGYGHRVLLEDVSAAIGGGRLVALLGRNGTGKSTLLRAVAGSEAPLSGGIRLCGRLLSATPAHELAQVVSFVTTEKVRIANLASRDVVGLGRAPLYRLAGASAARRPCGRRPCLESGGDGRFRRQADGSPVGRRGAARDDRACACAGHAGDLARRADGFSRHAQSLRVVYAAALAGARRGKCIFFSTHELDIALTLCDAVALIDPPRLHLLPTDEMIRSGHIERLFDNGTVAFDASTRTVTVRR